MDTTDPRIEIIKAVTQSVISILIIIGGGLLMYFKPDMRDALAPILSTVVAYYFLSATHSNAVQQGIAIARSQAALVSSSKLPTQKGNGN